MRSTLIVLGFLGLAACTASAEDGAAANTGDLSSTKKLLDCNVFESGGGPDQHVTVEQRKDGLHLVELTEHGSTIERPLSKEEWASGDIKLTDGKWDGPDAVNHIYKDKTDGAWMNESKTDGFRAVGYADCAKPGEE